MPSKTPANRFIYLHGFASGPDSAKAVNLGRHYGNRGVQLERPDLRLPSLERLRLSAVTASVRESLKPADRAVLFGSSLGGLAAALVAAQDERVVAAVLLAPAFGFVDSWRRRLGPAAWEAWKREGLEVDDHAAGGKVRVDFGFMDEAEKIEARGGPEVKAPVLIVHGRRDETVDVAVSRAWARGRPNVRLVEVEDGHPLTESLPLIRAEADDFLIPYLPPRSPR